MVEQHSLYHVTRDERDQLRLESSRLRQAHARSAKEVFELIESKNVLKAEKSELEEVLSRSQGERKNMADKINTLTVQCKFAC